MIIFSYNYPGEEDVSRSQHEQNHTRGFQAIPVPGRSKQKVDINK